MSEEMVVNVNQSIVFPDRDPSRLALKDVMDGLKSWRVWFMLAYQDIKLRYRRSVLGPFWLTLSMAVTVYSMGYLYGHLFHTDLKTYFPFLVGGMLTWALLSSQIIDLTDAFVASEGLAKQIKLPYSLYIHRVAARNIIIFFHNVIVVIPIIIAFPESTHINANTLLLIPGLLLVYINSISFGLVFAMLGARYRDVTQVIRSLVQVTFFVTPIMWNPSLLPPKDQYIVLLNPFWSFVELIRAPLFGGHPAFANFVVVGIVSVVGLLLAYAMLKQYRSRIVYWL